MTDARVGPIALVGGREWGDGCSFDAGLLERSGGDRVLVLPTAAAYEHPDRAVDTARSWFQGIAGSGAGAMVLGDPMVDPRGGAFTLGLGLIGQLAVLPGASGWSPERLRRTVSLADAGVALVAVDERTAAIRSPTGTWSVEGVGSASVHVGGVVAGFEALG